MSLFKIISAKKNASKVKKKREKLLVKKSNKFREKIQIKKLYRKQKLRFICSLLSVLNLFNFVAEESLLPLELFDEASVMHR